MKVFQKGFNYSQDGEGNRLVIHMQGCNMRCPWCCNPEGMDPAGTLVTDPEWLLESVCPHGAVKEKTLDRELCSACRDRACVNLHRTKGLRLSCKDYTTEELTAEVLRNSPMFYDGGGVTFTGGEATLQFEELKTVLKALHEKGIRTAMETNASSPRLNELFPYLSELIADCKLINEKRHKEATGISNREVLKNLRLAAESGVRLHVRVPLIGGVNDSPEDIRDFLKFFKEIGKEKVTFEILKYHEFGKKKWEECGLPYRMTEKARVKPETAADFAEQIRQSGLHYLRT
jgi:pyruvate formate lyase activating enzyme